MVPATRTALIIGASSGIGEAIARELARRGGWHVALAARRVDRLRGIAAELHPTTCEVLALDLEDTDVARDAVQAWLATRDDVELCIVSAGIGHKNPALCWQLERETIAVNALGFAAVASVAVQHFIDRGRGHLVGISSVAALRGSGAAPAYSASKAFVSTYLDGLRAAARSRAPGVRVTEAMPGFVDTAMMQTDRPFWVASPERAARSILAAIEANTKHAYVTRRWGLVALLLRCLPRPG